MNNDQHERLSMLLEEAGEVIQICGKVLRHGYDSSNPLEDHTGTNKELLEKELQDLYTLMYIMSERNDIVLDFSNDKVKEIWSRKLKWTHHQ